MRQKLTEFVAYVVINVLALPVAAVETSIVTFNDGGDWCWFQDERVIVHNGKLIIGTVAAGTDDPTRTGNIEVTSFDLDSGETHRDVLHEQLQCDDHNSPALLALRDGQVLAMYSKHGDDNRIYCRRKQADTVASRWESELTIVPSTSSRVTYSNLSSLSKENQQQGRLYNFFRGHDDTFKPSWMTSDDDGMTWTPHGLLVDYPVERRHRPYVKYASNHQDTIHFVFTEGHPRDFNNSIFHAYYRDGAFFDSSGVKIKDISNSPIAPQTATRVFAGDENNVAWTADLHLDRQDRPVVVYSVQKNGAGIRRGSPEDGQDHRYRYAGWDGERWHDHEIAYAGTRLYPGEDDYTGGICLDPNDPNTVFLSSDVDIHKGCPNTSGHYEIHRGVTNDFGHTWTWTQVTKNSSVDNLRPTIPKWNQRAGVVLWLRGQYTSYTNFDLDVVGIFQ